MEGYMHIRLSDEDRQKIHEQLWKPERLTIHLPHGDIPVVLDETLPNGTMRFVSRNPYQHFVLIVEGIEV